MSKSSKLFCKLNLPSRVMPLFYFTYNSLYFVFTFRNNFLIIGYQIEIEIENVSSHCDRFSSVVHISNLNTAVYFTLLKFPRVSLESSESLADNFLTRQHNKRRALSRGRCKMFHVAPCLRRLNWPARRCSSSRTFRQLVTVVNGLEK